MFSIRNRCIARILIATLLILVYPFAVHGIELITLQQFEDKSFPNRLLTVNQLWEEYDDGTKSDRERRELFSLIIIKQVFEDNILANNAGGIDGYEAVSGIIRQIADSPVKLIVQNGLVEQAAFVDYLYIPIEMSDSMFREGSMDQYAAIVYLINDRVYKVKVLDRIGAPVDGFDYSYTENSFRWKKASDGRKHLEYKIYKNQTVIKTTTDYEFAYNPKDDDRRSMFAITRVHNFQAENGESITVESNPTFFSMAHAPHSPILILSDGMKLYREGAYEDAIKIFEMLLKSESQEVKKKAEFLNNLAKYKVERYKDATNEGNIFRFLKKAKDLLDDSSREFSIENEYKEDLANGFYGELARLFSKENDWVIGKRILDEIVIEPDDREPDKMKIEKLFSFVAIEEGQTKLKQRHITLLKLFFGRIEQGDKELGKRTKGSVEKADSHYNLASEIAFYNLPKDIRVNHIALKKLAEVEKTMKLISEKHRKRFEKHIYEGLNSFDTGIHDQSKNQKEQHFSNARDWFQKARAIRGISAEQLAKAEFYFWSANYRVGRCENNPERIESLSMAKQVYLEGKEGMVETLYWQRVAEAFFWEMENLFLREELSPEEEKTGKDCLNAIDEDLKRRLSEDQQKLVQSLKEVFVRIESGESMYSGNRSGIEGLRRAIEDFEQSERIARSMKPYPYIVSLTKKKHDETRKRIEELYTGHKDTVDEKEDEAHEAILLYDKIAVAARESDWGSVKAIAKDIGNGKGLSEKQKKNVVKLRHVFRFLDNSYRFPEETELLLKCAYITAYGVRNEWKCIERYTYHMMDRYLQERTLPTSWECAF